MTNRVQIVAETPRESTVRLEERADWSFNAQLRRLSATLAQNRSQRRLVDGLETKRT